MIAWMSALLIGVNAMSYPKDDHAPFFNFTLPANGVFAPVPVSTAGPGQNARPVNRNAGGPVMDRGTVRWAAYREIYLDYKRTRLSAEMFAQEVRVLRRFGDLCGVDAIPVDQIQTHHLAEYLAARQNQTYRGRHPKPRTLNNEIDILNRALGMAGPRERTGHGRSNFNYIRDIPPALERLPLERQDPKTATREQLKAFVRAARDATTPNVDGCTPERFWISVWLLEGCTAMRRGALLNVPRPDDGTFLGKNLLILPARFDKNREQRTYPLPDWVCELLAELPTQSGQPLLPWISSRGVQMSLAYFNAVMRTIQRTAGIPESERLTLKVMRNTVATELADMFGDAVARKRLGHAPTTNTIQTNYKSRKPRERDRLASQHLADELRPLMDRT